MRQFQAVDILAHVEAMSGGDEEWRDTTRTLVNGWLLRGDGVAVYQNNDFSHRELGTTRLASFGSQEALLPGPTPPDRLPDTGSHINWRYQLIGTYVGRGRV